MEERLVVDTETGQEMIVPLTAEERALRAAVAEAHAHEQAQLAESATVRAAIVAKLEAGHDLTRTELTQALRALLLSGGAP